MKHRWAKFAGRAAWLLKKDVQIGLRMYTSHALALILTTLVTIREVRVFGEVLARFRGLQRFDFLIVLSAIIALMLLADCMRLFWRGQLTLKRTGWTALSLLLLLVIVRFLFLPWFPNGMQQLMLRLPTAWEGVILLIAFLTVLAFAWEFWGAKISASPQEIRFVTGIRFLLAELQQLSYARNTDMKDRMNSFLTLLIKTASNTICCHKTVHAGYMSKKLQGENILELIYFSPEASYDASLEIPLPSDEQPATGAAGLCFSQNKIVYVPNKDSKEAWPFDLAQTGDHYDTVGPVDAWITSKKENFHSVLCAPVALYAGKGCRARYSVLNFSTRARDPFVDRDFLMAECFSSILALAIASSKHQRRQV